MSAVLTWGLLSADLVLLTWGMQGGAGDPPDPPVPPDPDEETPFESDEDAELFAKAVVALESVDSPDDLFDQIVEELEI